VEAWETFLDHLSPNGILTVSRWFHSGTPLESYRVTSLAAKALRDAGVQDPRDHMILVRNPGSFYGLPADISVGNMLVSKEPFSDDDIERIQQVAEDLRFIIVLAPGIDGDQTFAEIASAADPNDVPIGISADISAPTDDRPYFFQMVRYQDIFNPELYDVAEYLTQPVLVLFTLALAMLGLTGLCILFPLALTTSRKMLHGMWPLVVFFSGIGLGFLILEIAQLQRLIIFLGHPTYALSVVLFSLLIFSGIGSFISERLVNPTHNPGLRLSHLTPFAVLLPVLVVVGIVTPEITHSMDDRTTAVRIVTSAAILAPMGLLMGMPFPIGMKVASLRQDSPTAFFWGVNGATSVLASVLGVAVALGWGISAAFWLGVACYVIATLALARVITRGYV
jgi:hypothetical protein